MKIEKFDISNIRGERLDRYLSSILDISRNQIQQLIKSGNIRIDGEAITKTGYKLKNTTLEIFFPPKSSPQKIEKIEFDIPVVYEDDYLLVLNKPPNLVIHPAPSVKNITLVDWLKSRGYSLSNINGEERHGIVHRLDKGTTGAILIAKDNRTHTALSRQLADRTMGRYYLAITNIPLNSDIVVEAPIGRNPKNRLKMGIVETGRPAKTMFKQIAISQSGKYGLVGARLFTGRTHQIRVHLSTLNRYIVGDELYTPKRLLEKAPHMLLHAHTIYFQHPATGKQIYIDVEIDRYMLDFIKKYFLLDLKNGKIEDFHTYFTSDSSSRLSI